MKRFRSFVESKKTSFEEEAMEFVQFACEWLEIGITPEIFLIDDKQAAVAQKSFGGYSPSEKNIRVNIAERHKVDVFRTLAHELVHYKQDLNDMLDENSGDTGSDEENEANSVAGIILREYAKTSNGKIFEEYEAEGEYLSEAFSFGLKKKIKPKTAHFANWRKKNPKKTVGDYFQALGDEHAHELQPGPPKKTPTGKERKVKPSKLALVNQSIVNANRVNNSKYFEKLPNSTLTQKDLPEFKPKRMKASKAKYQRWVKEFD